uniref:Uncharacterized protein n=1 Tax=Timema cristinae TaxID=61476 RepID=A0A7R9D5G2_TIMCR|nr:unnamed protein product [Timema cristinae]
MHRHGGRTYIRIIYCRICVMEELRWLKLALNTPGLLAPETFNHSGFQTTQHRTSPNQLEKLEVECMQLNILGKLVLLTMKEHSEHIGIIQPTGSSFSTCSFPHKTSRVNYSTIYNGAWNIT